MGRILSGGFWIVSLAKKARTRVDAIRRMARSLDSKNMLTMYSAFVRPILEYGSTLFMGATPTHLSKLDRVQATMERIGGFKAEPLAARREAALIALTLKQLTVTAGNLTVTAGNFCGITLLYW